MVPGRFTRIALFILPLALIIPGRSNATHLSGSEIYYECLNSCTIRVHIENYRDCGGTNAMSFWNFSWNSVPSACTKPSSVSSWVPGSGQGASNFFVTEITPLCTGTPTECQGGILKGWQLYHRYRDYNTCGLSCSKFELTFDALPRNPGVTSLTKPNGGATPEQGLGIKGVILDLSLGSCNSSPRFTQNPIFIICAGKSVDVLQQATDQDGDSLAYRMGPCFDQILSPLKYNPGYSWQFPLGSSWNVSMDSITGVLSFEANPGNIEVGPVCIVVEEWRNGVMIGSITRDMEVNVIANCPPSNTPQISPLFFSPKWKGDTVYSCTNSQVCFQVSASVPLPDSILLSAETSFPSYTFTNMKNQVSGDTILDLNPLGEFCMTPGIPGVFEVKFRSYNPQCPHTGMVEKKVTIISECECSKVSKTIASCLTAKLQINAGKNLSGASVTWSGSGGITGNPGANDSIIVNTFPGAGAYAYSVSVDYGNGCITNFDDTLIFNLDTINLKNLYGDSLWLCTNNPDTMGPIAGFSGFQWSNGDTTPSIVPGNPGLLFVGAIDSAGCYANSDTIQVVLVPLMLNLNPSGKLWVCLYDTVTINATPGFATYCWSTGDSTLLPLKTVKFPATIAVEAIHSSGCVAKSSDTLVLDAMQSKFAYSLLFTTVSFFDITVGNPASWIWDFGDTTASSLQNPVHTYAKKGTYKACLTVFDSAGCYSKFCQTIVTGILDVTYHVADGGIVIWPNPSDGHIELSYPDFPGSITGLYVYELTGRIVNAFNYIEYKNGRTAIDLSHLSEGLYMIHITKTDDIAATNLLLIRK